MRKYTPCDDGVCPYGANYYKACEFYCGDSDDEDFEYPDDEEPEE